MTDSEKNVLLLQWLRCHIANKPFSELIYAKKCKKIAVCGFREYGKLLVRELMKEDVDIACIIEKNYQSLGVIENKQIPIIGFRNDELLKSVDAIIVTPDLDIELVRENIEMAEIDVPMFAMEYFLL
jgi:hypothetical protein